MNRSRSRSPISRGRNHPLDAVLTLRQEWSEARVFFLQRLTTFASGKNRSDRGRQGALFRPASAGGKRGAKAPHGFPLESHWKESSRYDMISDATSETLSAILISLYNSDTGSWSESSRRRGPSHGARRSTQVFGIAHRLRRILPPEAGKRFAPML